MAIPPLFLFYLSWTVVSLLRPLFIVFLACVIWNLPITIQKCKLAFQGIAYIILCKDKKYRVTDVALHAPLFQNNSSVERKSIVFIRHGESTWNDTFNKGDRPMKAFIFGFIPGIVKSVAFELYLLLSGQVDSWFYDAPLSIYGLSQINKLAKFISKPAVTPEEKKVLAMLRGEPGAGSSILVSSNLRRALSTIAIGFRDRLKQNRGERILVSPTLAEISHNPDTLSITPPYSQVNASWIEREQLPAVQDVFQNQVDMSLHTGNKPITTNGMLRMAAFNDWVFTLKDYDNVICGGHSLYFRSFFRAFLPQSVEAPCKAKKMVNGGCVALTLMRAKDATGEWVYMIDEKSVKVIYGGF